MNMMPSISRSVERLPIRWRLALASFVLLSLLLTGLAMLVSLTAEQTLLTNQARALRDQATLAITVQLADQGITAGKGGKPLQAQATTADSPKILYKSVVLVQDLGGGSVRATILKPGGEIYLTSPDSPSIPPIVKLEPAEIEQLIKQSDQPEGTFTSAIDSKGQRELVVLLPLVESISTKIVAIVQLNTPTEAIDRSVTALRLILLSGLLAALTIAAALTFPLVSVALRPLVEMERVSTQIAAEALSLRLAEPVVDDEIGRMARAFNRMVARLEKAFTRQKRFVADVSHELRTPLTALGGSLEMLLLRVVDEDEAAARRLISGMYIEVERMQHLVADLLALTRLDEGRLLLRKKPVAVHPLIREVCERAHSLAQGQEICTMLPPELPGLSGDREQLQRVMFNIVENALKFTPPEGRITLQASCSPGNMVTIEVCDTGIGIAPEDLPYVFDRFYRVDASRTRPSLQGGGSGLGLSIARELVEAHGGTIAIKSTPGSGTTVTLRLPIWGDGVQTC